MFTASELIWPMCFHLTYSNLYCNFFGQKLPQVSIKTLANEGIFFLMRYLNVHKEREAQL